MKKLLYFFCFFTSLNCFAIKQNPLPYFEERNVPIDTVVIHCDHRSAKEIIDMLKQRELSAHYVIDYDGTLTKTVDEKYKAYHAGIGYWRGNTNINARSIGIEISNATLGQSSYNDKQIKTLTTLVKEIQKKYNIPQQNIIGHSDLAPTRKADPGLTFPWKTMSENGIGLWYDFDHLHESNDIKELLNIIGYDTSSKEKTIASTYAFYRRYLTEYVQIDNDLLHLIETIYPHSDKKLLKKEKLLITLKAVAYSYSNFK